MIIDRRCLAWLLAFVGLMPVTIAFPREHQVIRTGRYSTVALKPIPAQINPLQATVTVEIPAAIQTVGQAVDHSLRDSGYHLASAQAVDPTLGYLFNLKLPPIHRSLGPLSLHDVLTTLAGPAYQLVIDPVHRLVSFELKAIYRLLGDVQSRCAVSDDIEVVERDLTMSFAHRCYLLPSDRVCCPATPDTVRVTPTDFQPEPAVMQEDRWHGGFKDK